MQIVQKYEKFKILVIFGDMDYISDLEILSRIFKLVGILDIVIFKFVKLQTL